MNGDWQVHTFTYTPESSAVAQTRDLQHLPLLSSDFAAHGTHGVPDSFEMYHLHRTDANGESYHQLFMKGDEGDQTPFFNNMDFNKEGDQKWFNPADLREAHVDNFVAMDALAPTKEPTKDISTVQVGTLHNGKYVHAVTKNTLFHGVPDNNPDNSSVPGIIHLGPEPPTRDLATGLRYKEVEAGEESPVNSEVDVEGTPHGGTVEKLIIDHDGRKRAVVRPYPDRTQPTSDTRNYTRGGPVWTPDGDNIGTVAKILPGQIGTVAKILPGQTNNYDPEHAPNAGSLVVNPGDNHQTRLNQDSETRMRDNDRKIEHLIAFQQQQQKAETSAAEARKRAAARNATYRVESGELEDLQKQYREHVLATFKEHMPGANERDRNMFASFLAKDAQVLSSTDLQETSEEHSRWMQSVRPHLPSMLSAYKAAVETRGGADNVQRKDIILEPAVVEAMTKHAHREDVRAKLIRRQNNNIDIHDQGLQAALNHGPDQKPKAWTPKELDKIVHHFTMWVEGEGVDVNDEKKMRHHAELFSSKEEEELRALAAEKEEDGGAEERAEEG
jgi:hypothetical protein